MENAPAVPKLWADLGRVEREQVIYVFGSLEEFSYGKWQLDQLPEEPSAPIRFFMNALYAYAASFFIASGNNLVRLLTRLGHADVLQPALAALDKPLDEGKLRDVYYVYRNHYLSHPRFSYRVIVKELKPKIDMDVPANAERYADSTRSCSRRFTRCAFHSRSASQRHLSN